MTQENPELILLEDISRIVVSSHDLHETLGHITSLLAERLGVEVCSIYLLRRGRLVLSSTHGLSAEAIDTVAMPPSEGLTGLVFSSGEPVNAERAAEHPRYKFFPGIGEEAYASYLGVPLIHRQHPIGVLTVQTAAPRAFSSDEIRLLVTTASQLSGVIENARLLDDQAHAGAAATRTESGPREAFLRGLPSSPGVARGVAHPLSTDLGLDPRAEVAVADPATELARFDSALVSSIHEVENLRDQVTSALTEEDGAIFHAHLLMLEDRGLQEKIRERIRAGAGAARATADVARGYVHAFLKLEDPYLRERATDVRDVALRLLHHLHPEGRRDGAVQFPEPTVVVARDLTPSEFVRLAQPNLVGVVLERGGRNSHTSILCRSSGVPAVVGLEGPLPEVQPGQPVIVDGNAGLVYLSAPDAVRQEYERLAEDSRRLDSELRSHLEEPPVTRDGARIRLLGNAALLSDVPKLLEAGAEGVGLYRTEFPFLVRASFPDEDEQVQIYARILEALGGRTATLRTLDVGGDKTLPYLPIPREENPHLGWRSIRVSLELVEPFRIQVRALLRASLHGPVRIVFPMISTLAELEQARAILEVERQSLAQNGVPLPEIPVGAMIEVPSAALSVGRMAPLADFFSIGTNDLVQYILAVDRANRRVAHLYDPLHPAVLEVIQRVRQDAGALQRPVAVCGEMASRVSGAAALLALGIDELSISPGALPRIRRLVQTVDLAQLRALAPELLAATRPGEVRGLLRAELERQGVPAALWDTP